MNVNSTGNDQANQTRDDNGMSNTADAMDVDECKFAL